MPLTTESHIESFAIETLRGLGWEHIPGVSIAPGGELEERESFEQVVLVNRLRKAVDILNPDIPQQAREQAVQKALKVFAPDLITKNEAFHQMLVEKIKVPYQQDGFERSHEVVLIDFNEVLNNEFLAASQYTVVENGDNRRPDIILFVNGIPLVDIELKNASSETATLEKAYDQLQTYKTVIPSLYIYNAFCIISDGTEGKAGTISAGYSRFMTWKTADGKKEASRFRPQIETLSKGMLNPSTFLDLLRNFIVFEKTSRPDEKGITQSETVKKLAAYHQYYAVNKAIESTIMASGKKGNRKGGVVWHTQGSGKSLSMVFYAGKLITAPAMQNPTIVVLTDRNDLDDQLFDTFAGSIRLLRQAPVQANNRQHLKELLSVASGGIVFTTIQKFLPEDKKSAYDLLSDRNNIVVIADEAHRTQYGFEASLKVIKDKETREKIGERIAYGFAKYMRDAIPNATYIGFTGTPIESTDINTPQVFGQYVDIYDIAQAVEDGATVKIYYESRLAKVNLEEEGKKLIEEFDADLEEEEEAFAPDKERSKWTRLEAIVGNPKRLKTLAQDIVSHFERRQEVFEGKGMIVTMSRRIAADLYAAIIALRPQWNDNDLKKGVMKLVMTTSSDDGPLISQFKTTKQQRRELAERMKDPNDPLKLVIVRDMWLTGFDAPSLHTLYIDKPMRGHNLMQAIARVNRVFNDKPGGLVVDYLGIATDLKKALSFYSDAGGRGTPTETQEKAVDLMMEKFEVVQQFFNEEARTHDAIMVEEPMAYFVNSFKFNYRRYFTVLPGEKLSIVLQAEEHILGLQDGKARFIREVGLLSQAFALSVPHEKALRIRDDLAFFQAVRARLVKFEAGNTESRQNRHETAIKQLVDAALSSEQVIDIFDAAGLKKPEISGLAILSDQFLEEVKDMPHKNLAIELLKKLLNDEVKTRQSTNLVIRRKLLEMLETAIRRYQNNLLTTSEIIQELIRIAKEVNAADRRGEQLGLEKNEIAFYDALEINESAVLVLGDEKLKAIAREIAEKVRANATIDWTIRESARAKLMVLVRRTLNKYGYPPDKQAAAIDTVLKQAEEMADHFIKTQKY
jgi:type I restriction enzyme, R subunit